MGRSASTSRAASIDALAEMLVTSKFRRISDGQAAAEVIAVHDQDGQRPRLERPWFPWIVHDLPAPRSARLLAGSLEHQGKHLVEDQAS